MGGAMVGGATGGRVNSRSIWFSFAHLMEYLEGVCLVSCWVRRHVTASRRMG